MLEQARALWKSGEHMKGMVESANRGGVVVRLPSGLSAFVPISQLDLSQLKPYDPSEPVDRRLAVLCDTSVEIIITEVTEVDGKSRIIASQKVLQAERRIAALAVGDVREGSVQSMTSYGAYVELDGEGAAGAAAAPGQGALGLVHVSEISWNYLRDAREALKLGQRVKVKVLSADAKKRRLGLSIRQLQPEPSKETLDSVLAEDSGALAVETYGAAALANCGELLDETHWAVAETALPGLRNWCQVLSTQPGIEQILMGRQATEQRVVSQDLEIWMKAQQSAPGSFDLVARAGRLVQEMRVGTTLSKLELKELVANVLYRTP